MRKTTRTQLTQPHQLARQQRDVVTEAIAQGEQVSDELRRLVKSNGWLYVKSVANELLEQYQCAPPKAEAEKQKWESFQTLRWGLEALFLRVNQLAATGATNNPTPPPIPKPNASK